MDLSALVQNFGFPVAAAVFFIWMFVSQAKEHKQDLKDIAVKSVQAIDAGTEAIKDSTEQIKLNNVKIDENSHSLDRVNVLLSQQRNQNNGIGNGN
jgi:hypothetical protein